MTRCFAAWRRLPVHGAAGPLRPCVAAPPLPASPPGGGCRWHGAAGPLDRAPPGGSARATCCLANLAAWPLRHPRQREQ